MNRLLPALFRHNVKLLANVYWLLAACFILLVPLVQDPTLLNSKEMGRWGEMVLSLIGLLLYPHLALMEEGGIGETAFAKRVPAAWVLALRWLLTAAYSALLVAALAACLRWAGAAIAPGPIIAGTALTAAGLGACGMLAAFLARSATAGYIAAFAWYLLDMMTKGKLTGKLYLFSMASGEWNNDKLWLGLVALGVVLAIAVLLPKLRME
ncbi:hypothetical protein [Gorillibacterium massiliense]|uniref:hypothetical protein n=1 Tax=Gorillibacterium massiliense TaxID=1280390 RepID=UPI0004BCEB35|nr:hypothetical protein [Gorillibacterium massiliense]